MLPLEVAGRNNGNHNTVLTILSWRSLLPLLCSCHVYRLTWYARATVSGQWRGPQSVEDTRTAKYLGLSFKQDLAPKSVTGLRTTFSGRFAGRFGGLQRIGQYRY